MDRQNNMAKEVVQKFLNRKKPEEYDFKLEMKEYYEKYNTGQRHTKFILEIEEKINNENNFVSRWFAYKTLEKEREEKEKEKEKKYILFDCDNSNDTCELTKSIYEYLWGWKKDEGAKKYCGKVLALTEGANGMINAFGGDTMNSLGTTIIKYMKDMNKKGENACKSVKDCKDNWSTDYEIPELEKFAKYTSCIGNFVLVPYGFNGHRGIHPCIKDYWDLSLDYLAYTEKSAWLSIGKEEINQNYAGDNKAFVKYINMFFLWDYMEKKEDGEESYKVKSLFASHEEKLGKKPLSSDDVFPKEEAECKQYFDNANRYIKRRGIFMVAMLKIAVEYKSVKIKIKDYEPKEEWKGWDVSIIYKYIMEKVFLTDKPYSGYKDVFTAINEAIEGITKNGEKIPNAVSDILENAQELIEKEDANDQKASN